MCVTKNENLIGHVTMRRISVVVLRYYMVDLTIPLIIYIYIYNFILAYMRILPLDGVEDYLGPWPHYVYGWSSLHLMEFVGGQ